MIDSVLASQSATKKGTRIVKKGNEMDKNAFLRILTAELTNQDPSNTKDSTAFVAQMAQFSALEQMANLNKTMSFAACSNLIGKEVTFSKLDELGYKYSGEVESVSKNGDSLFLNVKIPRKNDVVNKETGEVEKVTEYEIKKFNYEDLSEIKQKVNE